MQEVIIFSVQHTVPYGCMKAQFSGYCNNIKDPYLNAMKS